MAIAIAPSVIRLNVWPNSRISNTVIDQRKRNCGGADGRDAKVLQKQQQNDDSEQRANEHRVAHGLDGVAHQRPPDHTPA